jgi:hypothetical protein
MVKLPVRVDMFQKLFLPIVINVLGNVNVCESVPNLSLVSIETIIYTLLSLSTIISGITRLVAAKPDCAVMTAVPAIGISP